MISRESERPLVVLQFDRMTSFVFVRDHPYLADAPFAVAGARGMDLDDWTSRLDPTTGPHERIKSTMDRSGSPCAAARVATGACLWRWHCAERWGPHLVDVDQAEFSL